MGRVWVGADGLYCKLACLITPILGHVKSDEFCIRANIFRLVGESTLIACFCGLHTTEQALRKADTELNTGIIRLEFGNALEMCQGGVYAFAAHLNVTQTC